MSEFFNTNRFFKVIHKDFVEKWPTILKISLIFSGILLVYWLTILIFGYGNSFSLPGIRINFIITFVIISTLMAPFSLYRYYNHKKVGLYYTLLPASVFEKYLSMLIHSLVVLPLITASFLIITDTLLSVITPGIFNGMALNELSKLSGKLSGYYNLLIIQLGFIFANLIFRRNKVLKTILYTIAAYMFLALLILFTVTVIFKSDFEIMKQIKGDINFMSLEDFKESEYYAMLSNMFLTIYYIAWISFKVLLPVGFTTGSYIRMKRIQY